jgi:hypothetical protein
MSPVFHRIRRRTRKGALTTTTTSMSSRFNNEVVCCTKNKGGGTHRGYSLLRHYPLMCTLALSLVVLCTSEAFLSSTTPFLPPRGGATRSTSSSSCNTVNTRDGAVVTTTTTTQRNLYMEDGLGGDEMGGCSNVNGDYYNLGTSSSTSPINGKSQPFVKKNGTKAPTNKIRLTNGSVATAATTTTRMPPVSIRNGFGNNHLGTATAATLDKKPTAATAVASSLTTGMANGVIFQRAGQRFGSTIGGVVGGDDDYIDQPVPAEFVAETDLPTDVGQFRLRAYRTDPDPVNEFTGREPTVIYAADKSPFGTNVGQLQQNVPIRIHDQCLTSEVFRSQR